MKSLFTLSGIVLSMLLLGCAPEGISVTPVTGTVEFENAPVVGALVSLIPVDEHGRGAGGTTDENGRFILLAQGAKTAGAMPGEYVVCVSKNIYVNGAGRPLTSEELDILEKPPRSINVLPGKYASNSSTDLKANVGKGRNHFAFKLTK